MGVVESQPGLPSHLGAVLVTVLAEGASLVFLGRQVAYHSLRALNLYKTKRSGEIGKLDQFRGKKKEITKEMIVCRSYVNT